MHPSDQTIETAVLRIFRDCMIHANGRLSLQSLQDDWAKLHLRAQDLPAALQRLERDGCLRREQIDGECCLTLLPAGARRIGDVPHHLLEFLSRSRVALELTLVDHRHTSAVSDGRDRRADDQGGAGT